jgi:hypothetical protein
LNLTLAGCSSAEPTSVSVQHHKIQISILYLQPVKILSHLPSVRGLVVVPVIRNLTTVEKKSKRVLLRIVTQKSFQSKIKEKSPDGSGGNFTNTNTNATKEPED